MKKFVEFNLEDGSTVVFETDTPEPAGSDRRIASSPGEAPVEKSAQLFDAVTARIRPAAQMVLNALRELNTPRQIDLEFGLKFNARTGVVFASVDSDVSFKVRVKWENPASR
jgi:hypothetical protein